jgi:ribosomal-protein-alanine N-acetyltransferase
VILRYRRIETPRLILRQWNDADVEAWADMNADPRVMEFFPGTVPRERSREQAAMMRRDLKANGYGWFVMERKEAPGFAGVIALDDIRYEMPFRPLREVGWRLPVHVWGRGCATEAAHALLRYAFEELGWPEVIAMTAAINLRSRRVMEKLGMTHDPREDFDHPRVPDALAIKRHVLYRATTTTLCGSPN